MPVLTTSDGPIDYRYDVAAPTAASYRGSISFRIDAGNVATYQNVDGTLTGWRQFMLAGGTVVFSAPTTWTLFDNSGVALVIGATGDTDMLTFDTTNAAEVLVVGATLGMRFNTSIPLRFGTNGLTLVATPDGTNTTWSGTGLALWWDSVFALADQADATKRARFEVGGITAGQTRVLTVPNHDTNLDTGPQSNTIADPGTGQAIGVTISGELAFTIGAGVETNTLAVPTFVGQTLVFTVAALGGGTRAVTCAAAINQTGNTIMTFNNVADSIMLTAMTIGGALRWRVTYNDNVALS